MIPVATFQASGRSESLNAARLINLYPEFPVPDSRSKVVLRSTPGLMEFATIGQGPIRGVHVLSGTLYIVTGTDLYSVASDGTGTLRGSAGTIAGTGAVSMASNANGELVITNSSGTGWIWNGSTLQALSSVDADFTDDATNVTFLDQYILYGKSGTGQVYASDLNDATSWNALSFATAESAPDNLVWVYGFAGNLWLFGERTTEIFYNAGTSPFAFARIAGAVFEDIGGIANTVADVDNTLFWLAQDGNVYAAQGIQPQRISTHEIEHRIKNWSNHYAFAYKDEGHAFYVLGADEGAVVYDATTRLWHERETFTVGRWRAHNYARVYGKHIVGDYLIGRLYEMSLENYADGDNDLQRKIISPPVESDDGRRISIPELQVHFEHGVGLTSGQGSDPNVVLRYSDDGGKTWSNERWASIGKIGEYRKRAIWRRLGSFYHRVFELTFTDPTKYTIFGANLR